MAALCLVQFHHHRRKEFFRGTEQGAIILKAEAKYLAGRAGRTWCGRSLRGRCVLPAVAGVKLSQQARLLAEQAPFVGMMKGVRFEKKQQNR